MAKTERQKLLQQQAEKALRCFIVEFQRSYNIGWKPLGLYFYMNPKFPGMMINDFLTPTVSYNENNEITSFIFTAGQFCNIEVFKN